ncbi:hypothetical protein TSAR_011451 [Trichomalopsis sarcophagae]|uniref:Uncharacterized protein n=1 Tax=Trichomalopsis sarcophagae TaxID=543379 RepID=A0A232EZI8_9HYME|nr:hypothetical protein TSAR_011451 [Trichomalopsis sarcophagae]
MFIKNGFQVHISLCKSYVQYCLVPEVQTSPKGFEKFNCQYPALKLT